MAKTLHAACLGERSPELTWMDTREGCLEEEGGLSVEGPEGSRRGGSEQTGGGATEGPGGRGPCHPTQAFGGLALYWRPFDGVGSRGAKQQTAHGPWVESVFALEKNRPPREGGVGRGPAAPWAPGSALSEVFVAVSV